MSKIFLTASILQRQNGLPLKRLHFLFLDMVKCRLGYLITRDLLGKFSPTGHDRQLSFILRFTVFTW